MMTAKCMWSKHPFLRITVALFFLLEMFSSHIYCIPITIVVVKSNHFGQRLFFLSFSNFEMFLSVVVIFFC